MKDNIIFQNVKLDKDKLIKLGFTKMDNYYKYETKIIDNQFLLTILIDHNNIVMSDVIELSTNEKFTLYYVSSSNGEFVGKIRSEYEKIINKVKENCCSKNIFKSEYAELVIKYIKDRYKDELEYLWDKFPNNAIARNKTNKKWYLALLIIDKRKIGIDEDGRVEIIDLLYDTKKIEKLIDDKKYFKGYHMNKKTWITIKLDKSVDIKNIYKFIDNSYILSLSKEHIII